MEWTTLQHLDLRHVGHGVRPLQPHAASFHPHQALVAVAIGTYIVEVTNVCVAYARYAAAFVSVCQGIVCTYYLFDLP
ncbi:hypothetical protein SESBI_18176 [Sesbania bispinosa]|nr:hypothetical protein SESBI_18176 [Sesbania bispinosa]